MDIDLGALRLIESEREIPMTTLVGLIEQALLSAYHNMEGHYPDSRAEIDLKTGKATIWACLLYTSPSPRDLSTSRMPSSA